MGMRAANAARPFLYGLLRILSIMPKIAGEKRSMKKVVPSLEVTEAPDEFVTHLRQVASRREPALIRSRGRAIGAFVPMRDLRLLEEIWERLVDESDIQCARKRLADPTQTPQPWEEVKARL